MERDETLVRDDDLFTRHAKEIKPAYDRAVREAILRHKRNGESIVIERDGKVVILTADEIDES